MAMLEEGFDDFSIDDSINDTNEKHPQALLKTVLYLIEYMRNLFTKKLS